MFTQSAYVSLKKKMFTLNHLLFFSNVPKETSVSIAPKRLDNSSFGAFRPVFDGFEPISLIGKKQQKNLSTSLSRGHKKLKNFITK